MTETRKGHPQPSDASPFRSNISALALCVAMAGNASAEAQQVTVPPEILQQLQALTARVQQLEKQLAQQKKAAAPATETALENKVRTLEHRLDVAEHAKAATPPAPVATFTASEKGFGMKSADGDFELKLHGIVQADARVFDSGIKGQHTYIGDSLGDQAAAEAGTDSAIDNILLRRVRPGLEGTFYGKYNFRLTSEFGNNSTSLLDAYVEGNYDPAFKVRIGKFAPSLGLERLLSAPDVRLNELSLVSDFLPSRDVGVQIAGDLFERRLSYSLGLFNGALDGSSGDLDTNTDKELQARLFTQPFIGESGPLKGLGFGIAASHTNVRGGSANPATSSGKSARAPDLPSYKTIGQETFFTYRSDKSDTDTTFADGTRTRLIPQFHYFYGNFGLIGEYLEELQEVSRIHSGSLDSIDMNNRAWQLTAAWTLTGEAQSLKAITPAHNFDPAAGSWGAWELVLRYSELELDRDAFDTFAEATRSAQGAENWSLGMNWYLNRIVRVSMDYNDTRFTWGGGGSSTAPKDRKDERVLIGRVQAAF